MLYSAFCFTGKSIWARRTAALDTVEKRKGKTFISVEEFATICNKLSKTHIEQLKALAPLPVWRIPVR